jgi:anti-sigma B factor antagonist
VGDYDTIDVHPFRVTVRPDGPRTIVEAHGELDLGTVPVVEREVAQLREQGVESIVLDLRELTFIDSSGLNLLLRLDAEARSDGFRFSIVEGDGPVRRLLELTNLADDFARAEP